MHGTGFNTHSSSETDEEWAYANSSTYSQLTRDEKGVRW